MKKIVFISILLLVGVMFCTEAQTTLINALQLLQQKNFVPAMDICNDLLAESANDPSVLGVRSQIYTATGRYDQAMQDADKALSVDQKSDRALYAKGEVLYYGKKDYNQALQQYDDAIRSNAQMAEAYSGKARAYMGLQKQKDALKVTEDALKSFPDDPELNYVHGLLNYQSGKHKLAVDDYDKVLLLDANWNTCQVFLNRGFANDALLKPDLAMQDFTKAIMVDPNNAGGYVARGNLQYNQAKYLEAAEDFRKAETLNPDNSVIVYNIGMSYYKVEDKATACRYFQKACLMKNDNACKMVVVNCSDRK